jgi:membrane protease YdiL (CAAX protease family)
VAMLMLMFLGIDIFTGSLFSSIYLLFLIVFVAPVTEEIMFRGPVWTVLEMMKLRPLTITLLTTLPFILAHPTPEHMISIMPIGFFLGWLREKSGSVFPTIICHAFNNGVVGLALLMVATFG